MPTDFLKLDGSTILVMGLANRKSVAYHIGHVLSEAGAEVLYSVHTEERRRSVASLVPEENVLVCDVTEPSQVERLPEQVRSRCSVLHGLVHSIAAADYAEGAKPFHETSREAFLRCIDVSCYSLIAVCNALKHVFDDNASVVTLSISTTRMASENYGYMAPAKAALDSSLVFLAKSFSRFSHARFNAVGPGLLKTASSAGIPGYVESYLYAEQATLRKKAVQTVEAANAVAFLLSPRASGINAQHLIVDGGMSVNYFDHDIVARVVGP